MQALYRTNPPPASTTISGGRDKHLQQPGPGPQAVAGGRVQLTAIATSNRYRMTHAAQEMGASTARALEHTRTRHEMGAAANPAYHERITGSTAACLEITVHASKAPLRDHPSATCRARAGTFLARKHGNAGYARAVHDSSPVHHLSASDPRATCGPPSTLAPPALLPSPVEAALATSGRGIPSGSLPESMPQSARCHASRRALGGRAPAGDGALSWEGGGERRKPAECVACGRVWERLPGCWWCGW